MYPDRQIKQPKGFVCKSLLMMMNDPARIDICEMNDTKQPTTGARYLNLDGLRGLAALAVVVGHIERYKPGYGFTPLPVPFLPSIGSVAVTIFFVLSGFIITDLLLKERSQKGKINTRHFYLRRMLRIFPLYFLVLSTGYFFYAGLSTRGLLLSIFFLSNLAFLKNLLPQVLIPIWSIGVEEQFYAVHPWIMRFTSRKNLITLFVALILLEVIGRNLYLFPAFGRHHFFWSLHTFLLFTRFDAILTGCVAAVIFERMKEVSWLFSGILQLAAWAALLLLLYFTTMYDLTAHELYAVVTAVIIVNLCKPQTSIVSLSAAPLLFMGRISYGVYMLHKFGLYVVMSRVSKMNTGAVWLQNLLLYLLVPALGILLAWCSYTFFESYFLRRKQKFS